LINNLINKKSSSAKPLLTLLQLAYLTFQLVASLKPLYLPGGIYHPMLSGEKGVTLTAHLNLQYLLGGASSKSIATSTNYLGISIILRVNLVLHTLK